MQPYMEIAASQIERDEGKRDKPYRDTEGLLTIGIGRNLDQKGLSEQEIQMLFRRDLADAERDAIAYAGNGWAALSDRRKAVLVNMAFNLGYSRLAGFKNLQDAIKRADYESAAYQMKSSKWYLQVGERAERLVKAMKEG